MNKSERDARDMKICTRYRATGCAASIAADYGMSKASVFLITKKYGIARHTARGTKPLGEDPKQMKLDPDAYVLVARKATKSFRTAQLWLERAAFLDLHPQSPLYSFNDCGIRRARIKHAMDELVKLGATLNPVHPFKIVFNNSGKYMELTHKQFVVFLANPFFYLLDHKADIRSLLC